MCAPGFLKMRSVPVYWRKHYPSVMTLCGAADFRCVCPQAAADCQLGIKLLGEIEASSVPLDAAIAPPAGVRTR